MKYVLDTNVLIHLLRNSPTWLYIQEEYNPFGDENETFLSFATVAEVLSIAKQIGWGQAKLAQLATLFEELEVITLTGTPEDHLLQAYVDIDSYSQGKGDIPLPEGVSARNMGKHDIWIAATAFALDASLISTDKDFQHLNGVFLDFLYVEKVAGRG